MQRIVKAAWAAGLLLALTSGSSAEAGPPLTPAAWVQADLQAEVWSILSSAEPAQGEGLPSRAQRLAALGPAGLAPVLSALRGEAEPPEERSPAPEELEDWDAVLAQSLLLFEERDLVQHLLQHAERPATAEEVDGAAGEFELFAIELLGQLPSEDAFEALLRVCSRMDPVVRASRRATLVIERAARTQLARGGRRAQHLSSLAGSTDVGLLCALAPALQAGDPRQLVLLARWLGRDEQLDLALLDSLAASLGQVHGAVDELTANAIRGALASFDPRVQRAAANLCGQLRDGESAEQLIGLLSASDARVARAAHWSLCELAGQDLGQEAEAWSRWLATERAWWQENQAPLFVALSGADPLERHQALVELLQHPLRRHAIAPGLGPLLTSEDPTLAKVTCSALSRLRSDRALPWLLEALEMPDDGRRAAVHATLRHLTGLDLPADGRAWRGALEG